MNIAEMHVWFRQYAQQMGMQNVRAILPEQIDVLINTSISDVVNQLVRENVGVRNDRVVTDNTKLNQINALRSLYKVNHEIELEESDVKSNVGLHRILHFMGDDPAITYAIQNGLYLVDLSIDYVLEKHQDEEIENEGQENETTVTTTVIDKISQIFPIRLIEDGYLADTLNDFVLKPRLRSPIAVFYQDTLDIYFGEDYTTGNGLLPQNKAITPYKLRVSYISKPNQVKYVSDLGGDNVSCDLPESMHVDILKHAVDLYNTSIQGGLYSAQQQQQMQNRETSRNEARPDNEGYQN